MKLHVLDGTYELFRAYFGVPKRKAQDGMEVGASYGVTASTLALLAEPGVTHVAVAFDSVIESFRNDIYPGYKSSAGVPQELLEQFSLAEEAMEAIGVTPWRMYEYEADDALATAARRWAAEVDQVVVMTPDKDMAQLYDDPKVVGFDRRRGQFIDRAGVIAKFGVEPESIPDYLALVGDSADGFPGIPGFGKKTASVVLSRYLHLESIPVDSAQWDVDIRGIDKLAASLQERLGEALLYRYLAQLRIDVPLGEDLVDLEWQGVPRARFTEFCEKLGFTQLLERPKRWSE